MAHITRPCCRLPAAQVALRECGDFQARFSASSASAIHFYLVGAGVFNAWLEAANAMGLEPVGEQPPAPAAAGTLPPALPVSTGDGQGVQVGLASSPSTVQT